MKKSNRPGLLAVRAVNQYRGRDVLPYLALRFYLNASAARVDKWVRQVSSDLVHSRSSLPYLEVKHFKEQVNGTISHRVLHLPCANEALAEAHLLNRCAQSPTFLNPEVVFSYQLSSKNSHREGVFRPYSDGLQRRQRWIASACGNGSDEVVQYTDIKRFYPSIPVAKALQAWKFYSNKAGLDSKDVELGERILADHAATAPSSDGGLLTGPMFSHFIGNLVLRDLDEQLPRQLSAGYCRYVDDIVLVGSRPKVQASLGILYAILKDEGFDLHPEGSEKHLEVSAKDWMRSRDDFANQGRQKSWMTFVGDLKRYLLVQPESSNDLKMRFKDCGFRIPVLDYSTAVRERSSIERILKFSNYSWLRIKTGRLTAESLVKDAEFLRDSYSNEMEGLVTEADLATGFERKRLIPKLRYRAGRMAHLGTEEQVGKLANDLAAIPELFLHSRILGAIKSRSLDEVMHLGVNATHAVGQIARAGDISLALTQSPENDWERDAIAIALLNGVKIHGCPPPAEHQLLRFAVSGADRDLMRSENSFIREIACLHGLSDQPRHPDFLETAFDEDEDLSLDAINQLQQSASL